MADATTSAPLGPHQQSQPTETESDPQWHETVKASPPEPKAEPAQFTPTQNPEAGSAASRIVQGPNGPEISGPVQVQNRVEVELRAKASIEEGTGQATIGYDSQKRLAYAEGKLMQSTTNVDASGTGVRLGYIDNGNKLGATSAPNVFDKILHAVDTIGMKSGFAGIELYAKSDTNVVQQKLTKEGLLAPEHFDRVNEAGLRLTANGVVEVADTKIRLNAEPLRLATEQKVKTGDSEAATPYKPVTKSTMNASVTATDQKLVTRDKGADQRNLPDGTAADVNSDQGLSSYAGAVKNDAADGTTHFHFQASNGGVSNAAMVVPTFDYAGNQSTATEISHGWMQERTVVHAPSSDPSRISRMEQTDWFGNTKTLVPIDAAVDWAHNQARNDPNLKNLEKLSADDIERANPGRIVDVQVPDGNGSTRTIRALEQGDMINLGFATVEGEKGIYRAPDLQNGVTKVETEIFFDKAEVTLASMIEPGAVREDGSVDQNRLYSKAAVSTTNATIETGIQSPFGLVAGASNLLGYGAGLINQGNEWLMNSASDQVQNSPLNNTAIGNVANALIDYNRNTTEMAANAVKSGTGFVSEKVDGLGQWMGDQYYDKLGWQMDAAQWEASTGSTARQEIWNKYAPEAQAVVDAKAKGTIGEQQANDQLQVIQAKSQTDFAKVQQTMPERLREKLDIPQPQDIRVASSR